MAGDPVREALNRVLAAYGKPAGFGAGLSNELLLGQIVQAAEAGRSMERRLVDQLMDVRRLASEMHERAVREQDRRIAGIYAYLGRAIDFHASEVPPVTSDDPGLVRDILEALCRRDGLPLTSLIDAGGGNSIMRGEPARNYELAIRLGIGEVFGVPGQ